MFGVLNKITQRNLTIERMREMSDRELGDMIHDRRSVEIVRKMVAKLPRIEIAAQVQPITTPHPVRSKFASYAA